MHTTDVPIQVGVGWVWDGESAHLVSCMRDMSAWKSRTRAAGSLVGDLDTTIVCELRLRPGLSEHEDFEQRST